VTSFFSFFLWLGYRPRQQVASDLFCPLEEHVIQNCLMPIFIGHYHTGDRFGKRKKKNAGRVRVLISCFISPSQNCELRGRLVFIKKRKRDIVPKG
jgi:hypothetical protein